MVLHRRLQGKRATGLWPGPVFAQYARARHVSEFVDGVILVTDEEVGGWYLEVGG